MKRYLLPLAAIALLASCTTEVLNQDSGIISHVTIMATDFEFEADTRTNLDPSSGGLSFTWAESDIVGIFPNAGDQVKFPMTAGAGTKSANFDGGGWALRNNYSYAAYYPFSMDNYKNPYTALPITYLGQSQSANNSTAGLGAYDYMVATASMPESGSVAFNFQHINSVLYIQLTTPDAATFTKLTLSAEEAIFTTEATVDISNGTLTPTGTSKYLTLDLGNISVEAGGTLSAWMLVAPADANGKTMKATLTTSENKGYSAEIGGKTFEKGKVYKLTGTLAKVGPNLDNLVLNGYEYVDLGLPSGTLWATMNVGATSPYDCGDYFAWGETEPKTDYSWGTYKYSSDEEGTFKTKYNDNDQKKVLELSDDVANVKWGGSWRMPTEEECHELVNEWGALQIDWTWVWTDLEETRGGYIVTGPNGNSIYLPATGRCSGKEKKDVGIYGAYWSSEIYASPCAGFFSFDTWNWGHTFAGTERFSGYTVRPVCRL